jgi:hypothetical protein
VPELWFDAEADAILAALERDPARRALFEAVRRVLDRLEASSGDRALRAVRFQDPPLWCALVRSGDDDWVVLWGPHPTEEDGVVVHYLGPSSFR